MWSSDSGGSHSPVALAAGRQGLHRTPTLVPDGNKIVFMSLGDGGPALFVMNADGSGTPIGSRPWISE